MSKEPVHNKTAKAEKIAQEKIRCDACPVMCYIADGQSGACDRYANQGGNLLRLDPHVILEKKIAKGMDQVIQFNDAGHFVTAIGAGTTYPDYKPAPFIVAQKIDGVDSVTVVTEGIFSYCGVKVKIDTDRYIGPENSPVRCDGEVVGHVTTQEYGSHILSLGGVHHLTGGSKKEGRVTCETLLQLCNKQAVELSIDDGCTIIAQTGKAPIINGVTEQKMRVGCGSATVGMFATNWLGMVDEVIVVDDHITGVMSEHQAGKVLGWPASGIRVGGRRSTPGRYFQVAEPGNGWGGTNLTDPLSIIDKIDPAVARVGMTLLMVSTTGEHAAFFTLNDQFALVETPMPAKLQESVDLITQNCEPSMVSVIFMAGAGGSLRSGVTKNPITLTNAVRRNITRVSCGGVPAYIYPGGGITLMVDVLAMPENSFGYVPTPALVAPIEFTMPLADYIANGGHADNILPLEKVKQGFTGKQKDHLLKGTKIV